MPNKPDPEQERLMRLREQQIAARDPLVKERKFNKMAADRERKRKKGISLKELWTAIPQVVRSAFFGLLIGLLLLKIVTDIWLSPMAMPVMIVVTLVITVMAAVIGQAIELRDNINRHL